MNLHLAQISSLTFQFDALRQSGWFAGAQAGVTDRYSVDVAHPARSRTLGRRLIRFLAWTRMMRRKASDAATLARFSDRELSDIGLNRGDIARIHDSDFAADYAEGRTARSSAAPLPATRTVNGN